MILDTAEFSIDIETIDENKFNQSDRIIERHINLKMVIFYYSLLKNRKLKHFESILFNKYA